MLDIRKGLFFMVALGLCGLATAQDNDPEVSYDGLVRDDTGPYKLSWSDPDVDFAVYDKVIPGGATFQFRAVKKTSSMIARMRNQREFWISDKDKQRLEETVSNIFAEEIAKSEKFEVVAEAGPDTLIIRGAMADIVSQVPPNMMGAGEIYLSSVGEATLIIEAVDSLSGEVIYRGVERRAMQRPGQPVMMSNTVTDWAQVRQLAKLWATRLREGLDEIHK